jgi:hypothetical protein
MALDLRSWLSRVTNGFEPFAKGSYCSILPGQLSCQRINFRLTLRRYGGEIDAIAFEERTGIPRLPAPISSLPARELRQDGCYPAQEPAIDQFQLALRLPPRLFHTR